MQEAFGAKPENILAGIGPSIGQCCYEVDDKVFEAGKKYAGCFKAKENGRYMANLQAWNRLALLDAGLLPQNIYNAGVCTQCNKELFFFVPRRKRQNRAHGRNYLEKVKG